MSSIKTFKVGQTYTTRSLGDSNCIISVTVAARTKSFITTATGERLGIIKSLTDYNNAETIRPWGNYSLCPSIVAN